MQAIGSTFNDPCLIVTPLTPYVASLIAVRSCLTVGTPAYPLSDA